MPQPARRPRGAELAQGWTRPVLVAPLSPEQREAQRLAELAGAFSLFGLSIDLDERALWSDAVAPYRAQTAPPAANDAEAPPKPKFAFPELARRGARVSPAMPARLVQMIDWVVVAAAAQAAALWGGGAGLDQLPIGAAAAFILSAGALKAGLWLTDAYRAPPARIRAENGVGGLALGAVLGLFLAAVLAPDARSAAALAATLPVAAMLLAGVHAALAVWVAAAHRAGVFSETIVLVCATDAARRLAARAAKTGEARIVAIADDRLSRAPARVANVPVGGSIDDLLAWEGLPHVDRIVVTTPAKAEARVRAIVGRLAVVPNRVDLLLDYETHSVRGPGAERLTGVAIACVSGRPHHHGRAFLKRALDLALGALLLCVFALPMLAIALAVKLDSKGAALVRQRCHGLNNCVFGMLKFRTTSPQTRTGRTRIGGFLHRTRLDDLPQLFNVLRGEMSFVGPRPHAVDAVVSGRELPRLAPDYAHRHRVKPGIVGWAQLNGAHGALKTAAAARKRVKLDLDYAARASLWLDLNILARLTYAALRREKAG